MDERRWYEVEALMADLTSHRHDIRCASAAEVEQRMRIHYPEAVAILCAKGQERRRGGNLHRKQDIRGGF
jgi:hypothetical protein